MTKTADIFRIHIAKPAPFTEPEEAKRFDICWAVKLSRGYDHYGVGVCFRDELLDADFAEKAWDECCRSLRELADKKK